MRAVSAPAKLVNVIDTCARLVDEPLAGLDDFIADYVAIVESMPALLIVAEGQNIVRPVEIRIQVDNESVEELIRQLKDLIDDEII